MPQSIKDLFDHWELVWHEGQFDLVPVCVGSHYIRHDENGDRTVTREAYAAEIGKSGQISESSSMTTLSRVTARGFVLRSSGLTPKAASRAVERVCSPTESRMASLPRLGCLCSL
jgi:hypothetical protein